jgi:signal transduction histidine kinase
MSVAIPGLAVVLLLALVLSLEMLVSAPLAVLLAGVTSFAGVAVFSWAVFSALEPLRRRLIEQNDQLRQNGERVRAVHDAGVAITSDLSLAAVLQGVVEASRSVVQARYGALAILDQEGRIAEFMTAGLSEEQRAEIGHIPEGRGLIGKVIATGKPYRSRDIAADPAADAFPPNHPAMRNFLGVPLSFKGKVTGNLYLTDKEGGEFTQEDEEAIQAFAVQAAIAIENARLYEQVQDVAVLEERERIGMDLHDGTIQAIYGVGLQLEGCIDRLEEEPAEVRKDLDRAIERLNGIIKDIRNYIFDLRPLRLQGADLASALRELALETKVNTLMTVDLSVEKEGDLDSLSEFQASQLFAIAHEALANVQKHAHAKNVSIVLAPDGDRLRLSVKDDGTGMAHNGSDHATGRGLVNMNDRAAALTGQLTIDSSRGKGTTVSVDIPFARAGIGTGASAG